MMRAARLIVAAVALLLAACSSAPKLTLFQPSLPPAFANAPDPGAAAGEPPARFWQGFQDPILDSLMQRALAANVDVKTAGARLAEARALGRFAEANLLPSIGTSAGASRVRAKDAFGVTQTHNLYAANLDVLWEADLFGRLGDARRAALANVRGGAAGGGGRSGQQLFSTAGLAGAAEGGAGVAGNPVGRAGLGGQTGGSGPGHGAGHGAGQVAVQGHGV